MSDDDGPDRTFSLDQLPDGDALHACRRDQLAGWLVGYGLAQPNGSPDTFELTKHGLEVAAGASSKPGSDPDSAGLVHLSR